MGEGRPSGTQDIVSRVGLQKVVSELGHERGEEK